MRKCPNFQTHLFHRTPRVALLKSSKTDGMLQTCETSAFMCFPAHVQYKQKYPFFAQNMVTFLVITTIYRSQNWKEGIALKFEARIAQSV
jgi:hypothetical protein